MSENKPLPIATLLIIAANIAAAFLTFIDPTLIDTYGFVSAQPNAIAAVACLFLHANVIHLLGNMVFLAAAGPATEPAFGSLKFFGVYLASGLAGVAAHWAFSKGSEIPLIGASGAVAGCVVLGAVRFNRTKVSLAPNLNVSLLLVVGLWLVLQILGATVKLDSDPGGTSYWAHIGGALAGLLLALAYKAPKEADRIESHKMLETMSARGPAAALAAAEKHLAAHPGDPKALIEKADALAKLGEKSQAARSYLEALSKTPEKAQLQIIERAEKSACLPHFPSMKRAQLAAKLKAANPELAAKLLESVVSGPKDDAQRPDAMLELAEIHRDSDPEKAKRLITELVENYPLHPAVEIVRTRGLTPGAKP